MMDERDKIIIAVVFSIIGFILIIIIICFIIWFIYRRKSNIINYDKNIFISHQQSYEHSQNILINKYNSKKQKFNTNDSSISLSFNTPHLINQNVKNLDKLLSFDSLSTINMWHRQDTLPIIKTNHFDPSNPTNESIYMSSSSSSSLSIPIHNQITDIQSYQQLNTLHFHILNELNHNLCLKQEQKPINLLRYSQNYCQTNDQLSFDYNHSITPSFMRINENLLETNKYSNTTLIHKANIAQLRDDTAILY
ncbi:unnamed protein product [Rotaria sp. Silwood1]|nr:unnamed protein product [Rotaria sp. Silwood1]CAF3714043.1 unnamed protein product [Rotaria sp. Silwood1]CAF3799380.1 unnamed protein product [Rotaria sp. Silwood1]CAF4870221.1 unnamed protein product [Rotaria sp. Silwood1]CAF5020254.1 unnamed protein product [Rotaria sp. Silwood1]